jgi:hydrogenase maturation protease
VARQRVVCVGNELCHDDGVASLVGRAIETRCGTLNDIEIVRIAECGLSSLDAFLDVEHVVVVDAVAASDATGRCTLIADPEFAANTTCSVGHAISLSSMLELVAQLQPVGGAPRVTFVGIAAENLAPFGTTLSPSVLAAVPEAVDLVMTALGLQASCLERSTKLPGSEAESTVAATRTIS